jgi:hypothetical protein
MAVKWLEQPEAHDYAAASDYLGLIADDAAVAATVAALVAAEPTFRKAKDILRAAGLALLPVDNPRVRADLGKIHDGKKLSPILLVRGDFRTVSPLQIADGYHRVCASYWTDEDTPVPCRLVAWQS